MASLTRTQVATRLGVAESTVRRLRERGALLAERDDEGTWLFDEASVDAYVERTTGTARAPLDAPVARPTPSLGARIAGWLRALGEGPGVQALRLCLLHAKSGEGVARERVTSDAAELDEVAERIAAYTEVDADARGGRSRYDLVAEGLDGNPLGTLTLTVASREPDADGTVAVALNHQLMSYNERLTRLMLDQAERARATDRESFEHANRSLREQLREARERIAHLERSAEEVARLREDALNEKSARELFDLQQKNSERRKDAVVDKILTLLPVVATRFAGPGASAVVRTSRTDLLLGALARSVRPDQWAEMAGHLTDEQKVVFVELLDSMIQGPVSAQEKVGP